MNKVFLLGHVTRDIDVRSLPTTSIANFGIAVNRSFKKADGTKGEEVCFVDCEAWGKTGEIIAQYFAKGKQILIEGRLKLDQWEDKTDGSKRSKLKVVVDSFYFTGQKGDGPAPAAKPKADPGAYVGTIEEEDIPFSPHCD